MVVLGLFYKAKAKRYIDGSRKSLGVLIGTMCCIFYGFRSNSRSKRSLHSITISKNMNSYTYVYNHYIVYSDKRYSIGQVHLPFKR